MITLLATIFVFGLLVSVHEFGHFAVAKLSGMKVTEFAIGFGPGLYKKKRGETLYSLRAIPLGGYNKISGMDPDDLEDQRNFNNQPLFKRLAVIIAGSMMNLLLPVLIFFFIIVFTGVQNPIDKPIFGGIVEDRPAAIAGLKVNDVVLQVNGKKVETWSQLVDEIKLRSNQPTDLLVEREGKQQTFTVTPQFDERSQRGVIGVNASFELTRPGVFDSFKLAVVHTYNIAKDMLKGIYVLIFSSQEADIAGPLGVAQMAGKVAQYGFVPLLNFAAFLSINLGLINLLPVPVLDGGHVVMLLIEGIRGKAVKPEFLYKLQMIGLALLAMLLIFSTTKDIMRFGLL